MGRMIEFNNILSGRGLRIFALAVVSTSLLCGCLDKAQDTAGAPVAAPPNTTPNAAPTINGSPGSTVSVGVAYSFQPTARDPEGANLSFTIQNKPTWATFSTATGALSGTPTAADVGTTSNIVISTSDGTLTASLSAFSLTVAAASVPAATGIAQIEWTIPTTNDDGSALADLAGHRIYYGTSTSAMTNRVDVPGSATSYTFRNLVAGTHYFSVAAYTRSGSESILSNPVSGTVL
jgi:Putative Ig domain/Fibronectin type III domain